MRPQPGAIVSAKRHHYIAIDSHGKNEAVVIVGVLADQVDPPGRY